MFAKEITGPETVPQVTVIIPARNALAWLPDAIASIGPGP